jgi:hypothetical protein
MKNLYSMATVPAVLTNFTAITPFAAPGQYTIPANMLQVGDIIHIRARVTTLAVNSTNTALVTLKIGSTVVAATAAWNPAGANDEAYIDAYLTIRTIGNISNGTFVASGVQAGGTPGTVTAKPFLLASTAIDTTVTQLITVNVTYSVANAGNQQELDEFSVDMDQGTGYNPVAVAMDNLSLATTTTTTTTTSTTPAPAAIFPASQFTPPSNILRIRVL